ncbi:MAG: anti-sigma factor family protein [Gemmataceae bacterium]
MEEHFLGYLFNSLDTETHQAVEAHLRENPAAAQRLEKVREALLPLSWDSECEFLTPPANLTERTLQLIDSRPARNRTTPVVPLPPPKEGMFGWVVQRIDLVVALVIVVASAGAFFPWLYSVKQLNERVLCQRNLLLICRGITAYRDQVGHFPSVAEETWKVKSGTKKQPWKIQPEKRVAGMVLPMLVYGAFLESGCSYCCPAAPPGTRIASTEEVKDMTAKDMARDEFAEQAKRISPCYGYSLGYRTTAGGSTKYLAPEPVAEPAESMVALVSDRPPEGTHLANMKNSPNHGWAGQNVGYQDGSVKFAKSRTVGISGDDIFLNSEGKMAAGTDSHDTVIGFSGATPW